MGDPALDDRPPPLRRRRHLDVDPVRPHLDRTRRLPQPGHQIRPAAAAPPPARTTRHRCRRLEQHLLELVVGRGVVLPPRTNTPPSNVAPTIATDDVHVPAKPNTTSVPSAGASTVGHASHAPTGNQSDSTASTHCPNRYARNSGSDTMFTSTANTSGCNKPAANAGFALCHCRPIIERAPGSAACSTHATRAPAAACARSTEQRRILRPRRRRPDRQHQRRRPLPGALQQRRPHLRGHRLRLVDQRHRRVQPLQPVDIGRQRQQLAVVPRRPHPPIGRRLEHQHPAVELRRHPHHPLDRPQQRALRLQPVEPDQRNLRPIGVITQRPQRHRRPQRRLGVAPRDLQPADPHPLGQHLLELLPLERVQLHPLAEHDPDGIRQYVSIHRIARAARDRVRHDATAAPSRRARGPRPRISPGSATLTAGPTRSRPATPRPTPDQGFSVRNFLQIPARTRRSRR